MSLQIHRAERADVLAAALGATLREPLDDPFATEIVCVPTRGVERWLAQRLSLVLGASTGHADGVCSGVDFPSPGRLVGLALERILEVDRRDDPWRPDRLVWPLLAQLDAVRGEPW